MPERPTIRPVLILGAGINGAALARELSLNRVPVCIVDSADLAAGATAYSSRLIHGGLRYLEYGDFSLVKESLHERTRLLRLAPHLVQPLPLFVPIERGNRLGGLRLALARLIGKSKSGRPGRSASRGLWLVRAGLWFYDRYARDPVLPRHFVLSCADERAIPVDPERYGWECAFHDAQIRYPERFVVDLLEDARRLASQAGVEFQLWTHHQAVRRDRMIEIRPISADSPLRSWEPSAVVNATGAWVDATLRKLTIPIAPLMAGAKGSHLITSHAGLRRALNRRGLYAEASDGRPIFVLPWGEQVLIGTTDLPFHDDPATAVAGEDEIDYLLAAVNRLMPGLKVTPADIDMHYCGVRPLPATGGGVPAAVSRRHWTQEHPSAPWPLYSVIGGKLTTCRSLAEQTARMILDKLNLPVLADSRERPLPGAEGFPLGQEERATKISGMAAELGLPVETVEVVWSLLGGRAGEALAGSSPTDLVADSNLPRACVRWVIQHEWVQTLPDLIERRLLLHFQKRLSTATFRDLALLLAEAGRFHSDQVESQVAAVVARLRSHFGKKIDGC